MMVRKVIRGIPALIVGIIEGWILTIPGRAGNVLRGLYYRRRLRSMGRDVVIDVGAQLINPEYMTLGDNVWIDKYVVLVAGPGRIGRRKVTFRPNARFNHSPGDLLIADNCHIAPHTVINALGGVLIGENSGIAAGARIFSLSHHYRNVSDADDLFLYRFAPAAPDEEQALISSPVVIEDNAALGANAVMLPGSSIGRDSWVGAGALVMNALPAGCIATGTPAQPIRDRPGAAPRGATPAEHHGA